jgi:hypothetical protein
MFVSPKLLDVISPSLPPADFRTASHCAVCSHFSSAKKHIDLSEFRMSRNDHQSIKGSVAAFCDNGNSRSSKPCVRSQHQSNILGCRQGSGQKANEPTRKKEKRKTKTWGLPSKPCASSFIIHYNYDSLGQ